MFKRSSNYLPFIGLIVMLTLTAVAYLQNSVFFDKILVCSLILALVFFAKTQSDNAVGRTKTQNFK